MRSHILVFDDDPSMSVWYDDHLGRDYQPVITQRVEDFRARLAKKLPDLIILDVDIPHFGSALEVIPEIRKVSQDLPILICSGRTDFPTLRRALQLGASDYISKQSDPDELLHAVSKLLSHHKLKSEVETQRTLAKREHDRFHLIGQSPVIQKLKKQIEKIQKTGSNVLIYGETGSGKERVARQLRRTRLDGSLSPFISVDSSTIQSSMAEGILFGYKKGAFTGADQDTPGLFEAAHDGIIFFDEISNMPLEIQMKMLRVLQEKEVRRLGTTQVIPLEFRVVAATNQKLEALVERGLFKADLYQRISVLPVEVPPLKERSEDIPLLAKQFIAQHSLQMGRSWSLSDDVMNIFQSYRWPGNIREMQNVIAYVVTFSESEMIEVADLPPQFREISIGIKPSSSDRGFYDQVADFEKELIQSAYRFNGGNASKTALALNMDRSHLYAKMKTYQIQKT